VTITGESDCPNCFQRVLVVRKHDDGQLIRLETNRTDGGWEPATSHGVIVAKYVAPDSKHERHGHHAHDLKCARTRSLLEDSRARIAQATTEPPQTEWLPRVTLQDEGTVRLPLLTNLGVRSLVGAV